MDYEFSFDEYDKPIAEFSMGHEALGSWFTEELGADHQRIEELIEIIDQLINRRIEQRQIEGREYQLKLNQQDAEVRSASLDIDIDDELPEDTNPYDEESFSECGLEDFQQVLKSWQEFILSA